MQLRRFYGIWLNISLAVILQAPVCLRENEARWHFEPRALGAAAAFLRFHAVRQPFQHREDYQSHQKTKLSLSNWWEEKSFSLLHHRVPEVIPYFPLNAWGIPLWLCNLTLSYGVVQCLKFLDNVLVQTCYLPFCYPSMWGGGSLRDSEGMPACAGGVKVQTKCLSWRI